MAEFLFNVHCGGVLKFRNFNLKFILFNYACNAHCTFYIFSSFILVSLQRWGRGIPYKEDKTGGNKAEKFNKKLRFLSKGNERFFPSAMKYNGNKL